MASTYLTRTPGSAGNRKTFTISTWVKLSKIQTSGAIFSARSGSPWGILDFSSGDGVGSGHSLQFSVTAGVSPGVYTTRIFRDASAWYHIVVAVDTTQATASNRVKIYINGVQETLVSGNYPTLNQDTQFNSTISHDIGGSASSNYFDGSLAHFNFIDGTAYAASDFGETDATTGQWKPKTSPSVTYGTNGFFLKFANSGSMGTDSSGNGNNFTVSGNLTQTQDTPSNVFCCLNANDFSGGALSNLNLTQTNSGQCNTNGTMGVTQGKWYWEFKMVSASGGVIGIGDGTAKLGTALSNLAKIYGYSPNGDKYENSTGTSYGASYTTGDIIGVAFDADTRELEFYKNGVSQGVAFTVDAGFTYLPQFHLNNASVDVNFGNGYFGTTAVSSANSDGAGYGLFEYAPPTGYYSLCTKNINTYG